MSTVLDALRKAERYGEQGRGGSVPPGDLPPRRPPRRRGPRVLLLVLAGVALVAAFAGGLELGRDEEEAQKEKDAQVASVDEPTAQPDDAGEEEVAADEAPASRKMDDGENRLKAARRAAQERRTQAPTERKSRSQALKDRRRELRADLRERRTDRAAQALDAGGPKSGVAEKRLALIEQLRQQREENPAVEPVESTGAEPERARVPGLSAPATERAPIVGDAPQKNRASERLPSLNPPPTEPERLPTLNPSAAERAQGGSAPGGAPEHSEPDAAALEALASLRRGEVRSLPAEPASPEPARVQPAPAAAPAEPAQVASLRPAREPEPGTPADESLESAPARHQPVRSEALRRPPSNAPRIRINILQWSLDPTRRFAYMSVEGGPGMTQVREGETFEGLTIKRILPEMVEFGSQDATFLLRAN